MKKPVLGPKRVGFLDTMILTAISGVISWTVIWILILYLNYSLRVSSA